MSITTPTSTSTGSEIPPFLTRKNRLPLENGDHLTREEFLARWDEHPEIKKAELIDGVVYMPAAVYWSQHSSPHAFLMAWLGAYYFDTPGVGLGDNGTVGLEEDSAPQPDSILVLPPELGSGAKENEIGYLEGPPDFVGEVAASSKSIDMHKKLRLYQRTGVQEYMIWRTLDKAIDWFTLERDQYVPLVPENGIFKSRRFPGLWLDPAAMIAGDVKRVQAVIRQGLATAEHAAFVERLSQIKKP